MRPLNIGVRLAQTVSKLIVKCTSDQGRSEVKRALGPCAVNSIYESLLMFTQKQKSCIYSPILRHDYAAANSRATETYIFNMQFCLRAFFSLACQNLFLYRKIINL